MTMRCEVCGELTPDTPSGVCMHCSYVRRHAREKHRRSMRVARMKKMMGRA